MLNSSPVIIFGNPRSGTRMCANVLGAHPQICITDEFYNVGMLNKLAEQQMASFMNNRVDLESLPLRKELMVKNYWLMRSGLKLIEKSRSAIIIGNKTPRAEQHYEVYEEIFSVNKAIYVYCARNAHDVLRSIKNLKNIQWSHLPFLDLFERYKRSYQRLAEIQNKMPDRIYIININQYKRADIVEIYNPIFEALGLECDIATANIIRTLGPQNTMKNVKTKIADQSPVVELSGYEIDILESCSEYREIRDRYGF